jgi:predicted transcriptional regulator
VRASVATGEAVKSGLQLYCMDGSNAKERVTPGPCQDRCPALRLQSNIPRSERTAVIPSASHPPDRVAFPPPRAESLDKRHMSLVFSERRLSLTSDMANKTGDRLSRREREIMDAVFALGNRAFAEDIRDRLPQPPSLSAVRVMLARLEAKGTLQHERIDARNVYSATTSPTAAKRAALHRYVRTFFGGSLRDMMAALVRDEAWADEDLRSLRGEIDRARKQRKQP